MQTNETAPLATREALRGWLAQHGAEEKECWVRCKRGNPPQDGTLWYVDVVEEALCFGWIDSTLRLAPDGGHLQKLTPRSRRGHWTELNRARARRMQRAGRMTQAGLAVLPPAAPFAVNADLLAMLQSDAAAWKGLMRLPALYRRVRVDNLQSYRLDAQRLRERTARLMATAAAGRTIISWDDGGRLTAVHARDYFLETTRVGFSWWSALDEEEAASLWGDPEVTRFICASGIFTPEDVRNRLREEIMRQRTSGVQYWPIFRLTDGALIGCCGLHPHGDGCFELGFHLRPTFWHQGYATEAAGAAIRYAFDTLGAERLFAGHNPHNIASRAVLQKLGFTYTGDELYPPTGLYHPSYCLNRP